MKNLHKKFNAWYISNDLFLSFEIEEELTYNSGYEMYHSIMDRLYEFV